jgi:hypothetical protein
MAATPTAGPALSPRACPSYRQTAPVLLDPQCAKRFATCQAHAMWFYGIRLDIIDGDDCTPTFVATLHALTRNFRSLAEVEGWLHALDEEGAPRGEVARFVEFRGVPA